jgi:DNA adenine methylase
MATPTVLGYYGSKARAAARIVSLLPDHDAYIEPFCGSLAVLLSKPPAGRFETVNDLDQDLMTFWRILRERPHDLERVCALTPHSRAEYAACWPIVGEVDDLERARRVWVKLAQGRGGQLRPTGWRYHEQPHGRSSSMPRTLSGYVGRFAEVAERLSSVSLECRPALEIIERYGRNVDTLLYVDPPYLGSTRSRTAYRHEMNKEAEHRELAGALRSCDAAVVLSGYHSPLYDELYDGWHVVEFSAFTGQANGGRDGGQRTEVLWSNRPLGGAGSLDLSGMSDTG